MSHRTTGEDVVLVVADHQAGSVRGPALELMTAGRHLGQVHAVWLGPPPPAEALEVLGTYGAGAVHHVALDEQGTHLPVPAAHALAQVVHDVGARTVLMSSTFENKETAARLAWKLGAALMLDVSGVERTQDAHVLTTQQAFAATWTLRSEVMTPRAVVGLKANAVPAEPVATPVAPVLQTHELTSDADLQGVRLVERRERPASDRPGLSEAQVVVVGGRGTNGDFSAVEDLADALGGAVGATRVATDEGWIGHEAQIGQTGVTISPRLYVGAGVSGAVHHRGGMQSSGTIVAVNNDPEAPIFEIADYGIVGDLTTVLPQAAAEIRRLRG
jgi:electron transfer flavoprotein alpha subunit